jgi:hypothetical protein
MFVVVARTGSVLSLQAGAALTQPGSGGDIWLPDASHPCRNRGLPAAGAPAENEPDASAAVIA